MFIKVVVIFEFIRLAKVILIVDYSVSRKMLLLFFRPAQRSFHPLFKLVFSL